MPAVTVGTVKKLIIVQVTVRALSPELNARAVDAIRRTSPKVVAAEILASHPTLGERRQPKESLPQALADHCMVLAVESAVAATPQAQIDAAIDK